MGSSEVKIFAIATLGLMRRYDEVVYKVYVPAGGRQSRKPYYIRTYFSPLALILAHAIEHKASSATLTVAAPITLYTEWESQIEKSQIDLEAVANSILKKEILREETSKKEDTQKQYLIDEEVSSELQEAKEIYRITKLEFPDSAGGGRSSDKLPYIFTRKATIQYIAEKSGEGSNKLSLDFYMALLPLTGSFQHDEEKVWKGKVWIFREKSEGDIEMFGRSLASSFTYAIRESLRRVEGKGGAIILVDTTHGLNIAAAHLMASVVQNYGLINYELERRGIELLDIYFYNSDPYDPKRRDKLQLLSHYYQKVVGASIAEIAHRAPEVCQSEKGGGSPGGREPSQEFCNLLKRVITMLRSNLLLWSLYDIETLNYTPDEIRISEIRIGLKYKDKDKKKSEISEINYDIEGAVDSGVVWLWEILKEAAQRAITELKDKDVMSHIERTRRKKAVCFNVERLAKAVKESTDWHWNLLREIMGPTAELILQHELEEWESSKNLKYLYPKGLGDCIKCDILPRESVGGITYRIAKPQLEQEKARNIVAHAGITKVVEDMYFLFTEQQNDCRLTVLCIAEKFPDNILQAIIKRGQSSYDTS
ncbi:hypothetical protein [Pyrobaculum neutrophilum]|uniref:CRISPR system endoribonuclease Csx1 CARF domain-containing protein n=1 Tax=Pyrobaculum neutrophilum (strain DSM 2338 / JCM 9278 / NBRC 100436 / V24Sta) TaxID=444157 RepID=B1YCK1_PYRNV|nr:hypothetical protein [Pyrobaculum neutrophilum]ACB39514.1 hypothetical protein Tneu_0572 [Pyrobaculum neutrophilum V24Sta]